MREWAEGEKVLTPVQKKKEAEEKKQRQATFKDRASAFQ